jgi:hydrogenase expression/formation protein HypC
VVYCWQQRKRFVFILWSLPTMCLAIPMQITNINGFNARCAAKGVERDVSLFLLQGEMLQEGDYVLIHVGYAIQKISEQEAQSTWELLDQMLDEETTSA